MGLPGRHSPNATVRPTSAEEKELCTHKARIHQPWVVNANTHTQRQRPDWMGEGGLGTASIQQVWRTNYTLWIHPPHTTRIG